MSQCCGGDFRRVSHYWILLALFLMGCGKDLGAGADSKGARIASTSQVIQLVSPTSVVEAQPSIQHELQVTLKNVSDKALLGVVPKLPCRCQIVDPLPSVFPAGATNTITFRVLTPFAGTQLSEIEFADDQKKVVGTVRITFHVSGEVPRLVREIRPTNIICIAGERVTRYVQVETIEASGVAPFISDASSADSSVLTLQKPSITDTPSSDKQFVQRAYRFPAQVPVQTIGDTNTEIKLKLSDGRAVLVMPTSIQVQSRAHLIPDNLSISAAEVAKGGSAESTFQLISRVLGDKYEVDKFDSRLLAVRKSANANRQQWTISVLRHDPTITQTTISLISTAGHRVELPMHIEW